MSPTFGRIACGGSPLRGLDHMSAPSTTRSMIYGVKDPDLYVYHYTSASVAEEFILRDRTLKFSSFARTNDPKESKAWGFSLRYRDPTSFDMTEHGEVSAEFSNALKLNSRLACFCSDRGPLTGDHTREILLRGFTRPRMWAQYADKHAGVCLVFDKSALMARMKEAFPTSTFVCVKVEYKDRSPFPNLAPGAFVVDLDAYRRMGSAKYANLHVQAHHRELFFEKLKDWRDESEWRIVLVNGAADDCYLPFGDALVGVVHGADTPKDVTEKLIAVSDEPGIEHMGLLWNNHCPWYDLGGNNWCYESRRVIQRMEERKRLKDQDA